LGAARLAPGALGFSRAWGLPMAGAWGMTELTNAATVSRPGRARTGAVGTACPGIEVRLARDGEVLVRGPLVMRGYYRDPAGPAGALDRGGWLRTGGLGPPDAGGLLTVAGPEKGT